VISLSYDAQSAVESDSESDDSADDSDNAPELAYDRAMYATLSKANPKLLEAWEQHDHIDQKTLSKIAQPTSFLQQRSVSQQQLQHKSKGFMQEFSMDDGVPRLHGKSLAQWGDFLNEEDHYARKVMGSSSDSDDDLDADEMKRRFEKRHGGDKPAAQKQEVKKEDAHPHASLLDTISSYFAASQEQKAMESAQSGITAESGSQRMRLNANSILDVYGGLKFDIKNKVEESDVGADSDSSIHLPMNRPRVVAKRAVDKIVLFATSEGVGTYQGGVQISNDWSDMPFTTDAATANVAPETVSAVSNDNVEGDSNGDGVKITNSDLFDSIKKVANEKHVDGHVDFNVERARAMPVQESAHLAAPTRLPGEPLKPASHLSDEDLAVDSIFYDSNQVQQQQSGSQPLTHDQTVDKLAAVVKAAKANKLAAEKKREEAEHPVEKKKDEDEPNPYLQGMGSDWEIMARKAKKDVKIKKQSLADNSYLSAMGSDWQKMASEASTYPVTRKSPVFTKMSVDTQVPQSAPVVVAATPQQDSVLTSAQASLQQAQSRLAKTQMHALTEEEAMAEINKEAAKEKAHQMAMGGTVPIANDGLQDLASSDPTSYGLVEALMKKQALGLIKKKEAAESSSSGAAAFQSLAGGGSGSGGSHNWLSWKPSNDDALVSNVLKQVANIRGGSGAAGLMATTASTSQASLPEGDSIKALPDDGLPDVNPFAANSSPSLSMSTLSTSATVTQHSQASSESDSDLFAAGAAATSNFDAAASSDAGASNEKKSGGWDFLIKSKDKLRAPEKWSQDDSKASTASATYTDSSSSSSNGLNGNYFSATDLLVPGSDADTFAGKKSITDRANNMASKMSDEQNSAVLSALGAATSAFGAIPQQPLPKEEAPLRLPKMDFAPAPVEVEAPAASGNTGNTISLAASGSMMNEADSQLGDLKQQDPASFALVKQLLAKNAAGVLPGRSEHASEEQAQIEEILGGSTTAAAHAAGGKNWLNWKPSMVDF
jgi:hypothetical protein